MVKWLKFFGLGFFSDKIARDAYKHGYGSVLLSLALAFLFILLGFVGAAVVPFSVHLDGATDFGKMLGRAVGDYVISVEHGSLKVGKYADALAPVKAVNTHLDAADAQKYSVGGYNLIIDARPVDTLVKFTQYAEKSGEKLGYEIYRALPDGQKSGYKVVTEYTDETLELTEELLADCEAFLKADADSAKEYEALKDKGLSGSEYDRELYYLYVARYYTDVKSVIDTARAPVLHDFYYENYLSHEENDKFCYFLGNVLYGSFVSDRGVEASFGGYLTDAADGVYESVGEVKGLIKDVFYSSADFVLLSFLTNSLIPFLVLLVLPLLAAAVVYFLGRAGGIGKYIARFGDCYKAVSPFSWFSALVTGVLTFILGFFVTADLYYFFMYVVFAAILFARCAVFVFRLKRDSYSAAENDIRYGGNE